MRSQVTEFQPRNVQVFNFTADLFALHYFIIIETDNGLLEKFTKKYTKNKKLKFSDYNKTICENIHTGIHHESQVDLGRGKYGIESEKLFFKMDCHVLEFLEENGEINYLAHYKYLGTTEVEDGL